LAGSSTPPRIRVPLLGNVSDAAISTAAIAVLAAWVLLTPIPRVYGLPTGGVWLSVLGGSALGVTLGARSGRLSAPVVLGLAALAVVAEGGLILFVLPRLLLLRHTGRPVVAGIFVLAGIALGRVRKVGVRPAELLVVGVVAAGGLMLLVLPRLHQRDIGPITGWLVVAGVFVLAGLAVGRIRQVGARPGELLVVGVVAAFLISDWVVLGSQGMRDLRLYLIAGRHFLDGGQAYATTLMTSLPTDWADLPFVYPPMTLPFLAVLAALPEALVILVWLAASLGASVLALRRFGVRWWWIPVLLLWPPFFEGLWVGNIAVLALLLFAVGPRRAAALPLGALFKLQSAVPSLWLVRERRWSSLVIGVGLLVGLAVVTLPFVGLASWRAWFEALRLFQAFEGEVAGLYGAALPRYLPYAAFFAISVVAVGAATVLGRGNRGLARFGIASVVASPSLYRHGFLVVLPGLLGNGETLFWLALGLGFSPISSGWWFTAAIAAVGTFRWKPLSPRPEGTLHPLGMQGEPWS
jgi:hypothetical protein